MNLIESINKNGTPDSLIFSFTENQYYAIWGFDEILSIGIDDIDIDVNKTINLFQNKIDDWKKNSTDHLLHPVHPTHSEDLGDFL